MKVDICNSMASHSRRKLAQSSACWGTSVCSVHRFLRSGMQLATAFVCEYTKDGVPKLSSGFG